MGLPRNCSHRWKHKGGQLYPVRHHGQAPVVNTISTGSAIRISDNTFTYTHTLPFLAIASLSLSLSPHPHFPPSLSLLTFRWLGKSVFHCERSKSWKRCSSMQWPAWRAGSARRPTANPRRRNTCVCGNVQQPTCVPRPLQLTFACRSATCDACVIRMGIRKGKLANARSDKQARVDEFARTGDNARAVLEKCALARDDALAEVYGRLEVHCVTLKMHARLLVASSYVPLPPPPSSRAQQPPPD